MFSKILVMIFFLVGAGTSVAMENEEALAKSLQDLNLAMSDLNNIFASRVSQLEDGTETNLAEIEDKYKFNPQKDYYYIRMTFFLNQICETYDSNFPKDIKDNIILAIYFFPICISLPSREKINSDLPLYDLKGKLGENPVVDIWKTCGRIICNEEGFEFLQTKIWKEVKPIHGFLSTPYEPHTVIMYLKNENPTLFNQSTPVGNLIPLNFKKCCMDLSKDFISVIDTNFLGIKVYSAPKFEDIKLICHRASPQGH